MKEFLQNLLTINNLLIAITGFSLFGLIKFMLNRLKNFFTDFDNSISVLQHAMLSILKEKLLRNCEECLCQGYVTVNKLKTIESLYTNYLQLGGNSFIKELYSKVKELRIENEKYKDE